MLFRSFLAKCFFLNYRLPQLRHQARLTSDLLVFRTPAQQHNPPISPHLTSPFPPSKPCNPSTMTANEVNDIVMRLLAAADHIRGREREEILHHVGRLSRAAVRERTAAVDEMQKLRKKIVQQSAELKRIGNASKIPTAPATHATKAFQPPTVSCSTTVYVHVKRIATDKSIQAGDPARVTDSRLQMLHSGSTPALDYGPDYGRLSRPGDLAQPARRAPASDHGSFASRGEQRLTSNGVSAAFTGQSKDHIIQEQPGFGQLNQARFLALQAGPLTTTSSDDAGGRSSPLVGPAQPAYKVTAANAEPVAPCGNNRSETLEGPGSTMQAVDQLLDEISLSQSVSAGQKRRASDGDLTAAAAAKKQMMTVATHASADATYPMAMASQAVPGVASHALVLQTQPAMSHMNALRFGQPTCTHCFQNKVPNCDGKAHCSQGSSHKCYYVLCDPATCLGAACVKIHPSQYDLQARKKSQPRRLVIGDPESLPADQWNMRGNGRVVAAMDAAAGVTQQPFVGLPAPNQGICQATQGYRNGSGLEGQGHYPFKTLEPGHQAASTRIPALKVEPARSGPMFDARGIKLESSDN
ncbi:hypothetical protein Q7P35_001476 [Cladosporium inversicolor]